MTQSIMTLSFFLGCMFCLGLATGSEEPLRMEPSYNPFFVQVGAPFSARCIKDAPTRIGVFWTVNGGRPEDSGFSAKDGLQTLDSGLLRSFSVLSKDATWLADISPGGLLCETDVRQEDKEEVSTSVNFFNVLIDSPNITEGDDISLKCSPDIDAKVTWSRDGHVLLTGKDRRLLQDENRTLVIQKSQPEDAGVYQCVVMVEAGFDLQTQETKEQTFVQNISVAGKPYLQTRPQTKVMTLLNASLVLTCPVHAYPAPEVFWLREGDVPVHTTPRHSYAPYRHVTDAILNISRVKKEDLGVYYCVAKNSIGQIAKVYHVGLVGGSLSERCHAGFTGVLVGLFVVVVLNEGFLL